MRLVPDDFHPAAIPLEDFRLLFEHAPGAFLILLPDAAFTIVGVTNEYLRETLTKREEILGKGLFEVFPDNPDTPDANSTRNLRASLDRVVATKAADTMAVQRYDVPGGDGQGFALRYWSPINMPALSADGGLQYIIHRVQNITDYMLLLEDNERKQQQSAELSAQNQKMEAEIVLRSRELASMNEQLRCANETLLQYANRTREEAQHKDEFIAMLAHELRNPLAGISYSLKLLDMIGNDAGKAAELRAVCRRQTGNLTRLVDDLLDVSRISRGAVQLRKTPLAFRNIVQSALHALRGLFDTRGIALKTHIADESFSMLGDSTRLEQVVTNLLANAAKYTERGGEVQIALAKERDAAGEWAVLEVKDTGCGIPADKLSAIFDMFVQVHTSIDRAGGGLGIGLTLVHKLAEMHGGTVSAYSEGSGRGSSFRVRLPIAFDLEIADAPQNGAPAQSLKRTLRVLIIEDNPDSRDTLQCLLESYGHAVEAADNGAAGLQRLLDWQPDIAIADIGLPELSGFELARRTRASPHGQTVRLIALSGYGGPDNEHKAIEAGFEALMVKPVDFEALMNVLEEQGEA